MDGLVHPGRPDRSIDSARTQELTCEQQRVDMDFRFSRTADVWTLIITAHAALGDVRLAGRVLEDAVRDGACVCMDRLVKEKGNLG